MADLHIMTDSWLQLMYAFEILSSSGGTQSIDCMQWKVIDYVVVQLVKELRTTDASVIYVGVQHTQYACTRCKAHARKCYCRQDIPYGPSATPRTSVITNTNIIWHQNQKALMLINQYCLCQLSCLRFARRASIGLCKNRFNVRSMPG